LSQNRYCKIAVFAYLCIKNRVTTHNLGVGGKLPAVAAAAVTIFVAFQIGKNFYNDQAVILLPPFNK
jgi:hypothetical protein